MARREDRDRLRSGGSFVQLRSHKSSFSLERGVDVDLAQYPYLSWRWKVGELPRGGDFRKPPPMIRRRRYWSLFRTAGCLTYIWDTAAPKGTMASASSIPLVHIYAVRCESGAEKLNRWVSEARNLAEDYERATAAKCPE